MFENAPEPSSARKTPIEQKTKLSRTRELKKADCEVVFFFISRFFFLLFAKEKPFRFGDGIKMVWYVSLLFITNL